MSRCGPCSSVSQQQLHHAVELFPTSGSFNHGWSGGPLTLLDEDVAGITATSPGFATFDVRPVLGTTLTLAGANVPSPYVRISISAARDAKDCRLSVRVPARQFGPRLPAHQRGLVNRGGAIH